MTPDSLDNIEQERCLADGESTGMLLDKPYGRSIESNAYRRCQNDVLFASAGQILEI